MFCGLHLRQIVRRLPEVEAAGTGELVVSPYTVQEVVRHESDLLMTVVADPHRNLYRRFGAERSAVALLGSWRTIPRAVPGAVVMVALTRRLPPLMPTGGELGCPANILIDSSRIEAAAKDGAHTADQWSVDKLLEIVSSASAFGEASPKSRLDFCQRGQACQAALGLVNPAGEVGGATVAGEQVHPIDQECR